MRVALLSTTLAMASAVVSTAAMEESAPAASDAGFPVRIRVDAGETLGPWRPVWRFFGADEPNYATWKNGRKLLAELGGLAPQQIYFRAHNLLTSGDGTPALKWGSTGAYGQDAQGRAVYQWAILDGIFDSYLQSGVRPYVEIGFMPKALSSKPEPYQHHWTPTAGYDEIFTGWAYPPNDYAKWGELVYEWAKHCVDRYGRGEVESWYWETWNEPNIGYWRGTPEAFYKLHDYAITGVRRWEGRMWPAAAAGSCGDSWITVCMAPTTPPAGSARRSISSLFTPKAHRFTPTTTCAWASRINCAPSMKASGSSLPIPT